MSVVDTMELLVMRKGLLELRMYKEKAHPRPHIHIEYKSEFEASYALDPVTLLAGYMPRKYEDTILPFVQANRSLLIDRWRTLNGAVRITRPAS